MTENKKDFLDEKESRNKTELANRIAEQSQKVANTYRSMESGLFRIFVGGSSRETLQQEIEIDF